MTASAVKSRTAAGAHRAAGAPDGGGKHTPSSNTGCEYPTFGIHYLQFLIGATFEMVNDCVVNSGFIPRYFEAEWSEWEQIGQTGDGLRVFSGCNGLVQVVELGQLQNWFYACHLRFRGDACQRLGVDGVRALYDILQAYRPYTGQLLKYRTSRVDLAFDAVPFTVDQVVKAARAGNIRSRSVKPETVSFIENLDGKTCYLGNRRGACYIRVYDKRGPVRFELEAKQNLAEMIGVLLKYTQPADYTAVSLSVVRKCLDFVDRKQKRQDKAKFLPWWRDFVQGVTKWKPVIESKPRLEKYGVVSANRILDKAMPLIAAVEAQIGAQALLSKIWSARLREEFISWRNAAVLLSEDQPPF